MNRTWLRFSLRSLLVVLTVVCLVLGVVVSRAERQRRAVAAIVNAGGHIAYDYEEADENPDDNLVELPGPDWLCELLGVDYFGTVTWVRLLPSETFPPPDQPTPDELAVHIGRLRSVESVLLFDTRISHRGLAELSGLTSLRELRLENTDVTDADLARFKNLRSLEKLRLDGTQVTGAGLPHLSKLTKLRELSLNRTRVDDGGLAHLRGLTRLEALELDDTQVTDAGLPHLAGLTVPHKLCLFGTPVTGNDFSSLHGLTNLRWLWIDNKQQAAPGSPHLLKALPDCTIIP